MDLNQFLYCSHAAFIKEPVIYHSKMKSLLKQLPKPNYETLKYILALLVLVSRHENQNKMNATALGIVFGPNIFR